VDAAHIVPLTHPQSTDEVTNGLALCRIHHGAYDNALLGVQSNYSIVLNHAVSDRLKELDLARYLESFSMQLPQKIQVPASIEARPSPTNLKLGLEARRWPTRLIV
jgi:putative restriction endonuclease